MDSQIVLFMKNSKIINSADNTKEIKICSHEVFVIVNFVKIRF